MKQTRITITHKGSAFNQIEVEKGFKWLADQMSSADLAGCDYLSAGIDLTAETRVEVEMGVLPNKEKTPSDEGVS